MNRLMNADDVAAFLGVKKSTIYQWTHEDYIPHVKIGNLLRFEMESLIAWIKARERPGRTTREVDTKRLLN